MCSRLALSIFFLVKIAFCTEVKNRRILLDDPNYVLQHELSSMKAQLQEQQVMISQLEKNASAQLHEQLVKITQLEKNFSAQEMTIKHQQSLISDLQNNQNSARQHAAGSGAVYTRWGRKECPDNTTELVYSVGSFRKSVYSVETKRSGRYREKQTCSQCHTVTRGIVGGSMNTQTSAAAEYVCLPTDPIWSKYDDAVQDLHSKMHGGEYQENFFTSGLHDNDVPCAVCRRQSATSVIMLPGRNQCYSGWKTEYYGYLSSGGYPNLFKSATQFVCLDVSPEVIFHSSRNDDGKLFYMVEGICGSLSCPPYVNGRELTCAVCTK